MTKYQIEIFPTLATIAEATACGSPCPRVDTPHLTPLPSELPKLAGGVYTIKRSAAAPSSLTLELMP